MKALITGITGQDGSYLAELLLEKGYEVWGLVRRTSYPNNKRINHLKDRIKIVEADLLDECSLIRALIHIKPTEVYNLAAQSFVPTSWMQSNHTSMVTGIGVMNVLNAIIAGCENAKFYQASSSEMFGGSQAALNEESPFCPRSPYGIAKVYGHYVTVNYRQYFDIFATSGILFNHESPRRGNDFVTRKITRAVAGIKKGKLKRLELGHLEVKRDWGYAPDYVRAMWMMLQKSSPTDYVIATGEQHTVREFADIAFKCVGLDYREYMASDSGLMRRNEVDSLLGDASKARRELGWKPETSFEQMIELMVKVDMDALS